MQEKALVAHLELHKKVVKNAWILSYEGRKVLVIEFQETVTEDESIAYIFALAKSLVSGKGRRGTIGNEPEQEVHKQADGLL